MIGLPCQYAVIRFLPYAETGEFANVGVVLACPERRYLEARLMSHRKTGRISGFFEQLDLRIFRETMRHLGEELGRVHSMVADCHEATAVRRAFDNVTRPREALIRFSDVRAVMADAPDVMLATLFERFVERDFATRDYHDRILERGVREALRKANLRRYFDIAEIGNDDMHIRLPFVHQRGGHPLLAIKPLDLARGEANKVFETGGNWLARVERFHKHGLLPEDLLFAVKMPPVGEARSHMAAIEIVDELRAKPHVQVVELTDTSAITGFAAAAVQ